MFLALLILLHVAIVNGFRSPSQIIVFNAAQVRANSQPLNRNSHVRVADSSLSARGLPLWASNTAAEVEEQERADAILIRRIEEEVMAESGVALDQLINPSKVVNLERDLMQLRMRRDSGELSSAELRVVDETIKKKEKILFMEKRAVMRGWLKNLFVGQSVLAALVSVGMVYDALPGFPHLNLEYRVLGFWMWWLFILPSLRARKPVAQEKEALNIAFLATPLVSLALPAVTKDTAVIWWANFACVAAAYAYCFSRPADSDAGDAPPAEGRRLPSALAAAFKALDYGSGQERGLRK